MGQFKPMVKMYTTEPTVELKLKKGGHVKMPKKAVKKMDGGTMGALAAAPAARVPAVAPAGRSPARPSMAARRRAMIGQRGMAAPVMAKKGGEMETKAEHAKEATKAELKAHADKPASKAHKGLKTGGVVKGQGGYKTGGVVKGQGGFKKGGAVKKAEGGDMKPLNAQAARETKGYQDHYKREAEENRAMSEAMNPMNLLRKARDAFKGQGAVTTTEREVSRTVSPPQNKRKGGYSKGSRC